MARLVLPGLRSHSLGALAAHFGLADKSVPYQEFKVRRDLDAGLYHRLGAGCLHDCALTYEIFKRLLPYVPREELRIIDMTVRMFTEPTLQLDVPRLTAFRDQEVMRKTALLASAGVTEEEMQSAPRFRQALEAIGYDCPMKRSPTTGEDIPAIAKSDEAMQELLEHDDPQVAALAAARLGVKSTIDETRATRLLDTFTRGALPVYLSYASAKTLRYGGGDKTNWQNFRRGGEIRKSIKAPPGYKFVIVDGAQVECRGVNWLAGQESILDLFRARRDVYCELGSRMYQRPITKDDTQERWLAKQVELGCGFGLGPPTLQRKLRAGQMGGIRMAITDEQAVDYVGTYRSTHERVVQLWSTAGKIILPALARGERMTFSCLEIEDNWIFGPNGAGMSFEGLYWGYYDPANPADGEEPQWWHPGRRGKVKYYGGKLVENIIQFLFSGLLIRQAMLKIGAQYKIVLQVHDEIVFLARDAEAADALEWALDILRTSPWWAPDIPLDAEGMVSDRYDK
jgi:DNA polymerase